jgi:putative hemin transport protein
MTLATIRERFTALRHEGKRHRDAAAAMGISEGEAIAAHAGAHDAPIQAKPLRGPWIGLLQALELCGPLLALTRNESTVHEKTGVYQKLSANGHVGLALGEEIDLRLFFDKWHAGFAVTEAAANSANPPSLSLQFFDAQGLAVHKIFTRETTDRDAFLSVMAQFSDATLGYVFRTAEPATVPRGDAEIDVAGLGEAWSAMKDTHEFFGLLRKFDAERQQSFRLMRGRFTAPLETGAVRALLHEASFAGTPIMVFVGSPGCIQIHSGPVTRIEPMTTPSAQWINVLDAGFNLHLREDMIANVWAVEKPTSDGVVTSVEAFDRGGGLMAMFFGTRKPGMPERDDWRALVRKLARLELASV